MPAIAYLECSRCPCACLRCYTPQTVCPVCPRGPGLPPPGTLYVRYDLSALKGSDPREVIRKAAAASPWPGMWRYCDVLPDVEPVTLGEGWTPMLHSRRYANVWVKEEGANPTGAFKARGLAAGRHDGEALWPEETRSPLCRQRRRRPSLLTLPLPASRPTSSCRAMCPSPTTWKPPPTAPT